MKTKYSTFIALILTAVALVSISGCMERCRIRADAAPMPATGAPQLLQT